MRFLRVFALFCGLTMLIAGCASGPAELGKAEETLTAKIAEDAGYREYALSIIGDSTAAYASAARVDAIQNGGRKGALSAIPMLDLSNEAERAALMQAYEGRGSVKLQAATRLAAEGDGSDAADVDDAAPTVFVKDARYDKMMEAFGGLGFHAESPDALRRAVNEAMDSGRPALVNAVIDPQAGTESGRIGNLNPQSVVSKK